MELWVGSFTLFILISQPLQAELCARMLAHVFTRRFALQANCSLFAKLPPNLALAKSFQAFPEDVPVRKVFGFTRCCISRLPGEFSSFVCQVKGGKSVHEGLCLVWGDSSYV